MNILRQLRWRLTLNYTIVTVSAFLVVVLILGGIVFPRIFVQTTIVNPEGLIRILQKNNGPLWRGIEKLYVSRVNVGTGFIKCEHGILPVPAPAGLALMSGKPIYSSGVETELLTPTGAVLLTSLGSEFGRMPGMTVEKIGYGAGRDDLPHPNLLRLIIGREEPLAGKEKVMVVETNIDDMNPQFYDYVMERLLAMEVQEVFLTPILMKKNRPATLLTIICPEEKLSSAVDFLLTETTTLGLRWREEERSCLPRMAKGLRGETLDSVRDGLDTFYAKNPGRLQRPVIETIHPIGPETR